MRSSCYYRFTWLIVLLLVANNCFAVAVPKYNGRMNTAVKGVIQTKMKNQGFAANDPCFNATVSAVGSGVLYAAQGVILGFSWPSILIGAGVSALVGYAVPLAMDKSILWLFGNDGKITTTLDPHQGLLEIAIGDKSYPVTYEENVGCTIKHSDYLNIPGLAYRMDMHPNSYYEFPSGQLYRYGGMFVTLMTFRIFNGQKSSNSSLKFYGGFRNSPDFQDFVYFSSMFYCKVISDNEGETVINIPERLPSSSFTGSADDAINSLPESLLKQPLSPEMLALAANAAWKSAKPNQYDQTIPWTANDPITAADVQHWAAANPSQVPRVGDFISPASPFTGADSAAKNNLEQDRKSNQRPHLERKRREASQPTDDKEPHCSSEISDPEIDRPDLEDIPTAEIILAPLLNLMSDLKNFSLPEHSAMCPVASFTVFGQEYQLRTHCDLIEQNRLLIETAMALAWALTALFIVLRA